MNILLCFGPGWPDGGSNEDASLDTNSNADNDRPWWYSEADPDNGSTRRGV